MSAHTRNAFVTQFPTSVILLPVTSPHHSTAHHAELCSAERERERERELWVRGSIGGNELKRVQCPCTNNINSHSQKLFSHTYMYERTSESSVSVSVSEWRCGSSLWCFRKLRIGLSLLAECIWRCIRGRTFGSLMFVLLLLLLSLFGKLFVCCGQLTRVCCCCIVVVDLIWWVIIMIAIRAVDWLGNKVIRQVWLSVTEVYVCVCAACLERMWVQLAGQLSGAH